MAVGAGVVMERERGKESKREGDRGAATAVVGKKRERERKREKRVSKRERI